MSWNTIVGHGELVGRLRTALAAGRLHPALLFEGPEGVGKRLAALTLARALHCPAAPSRIGDPCGTCRICLAIDGSADRERTTDNQSAHPGVRVVTLSRPDEREVRFGASAGRGEVRAQITVSQIRVVLAEAAMRGAASGPRVVIIDPADRMGDGAANALLKTLEEPGPYERFVLVTARPSALLPTIVSRCVRFRFGLLRAEELCSALESRLGDQGGAPGPDVNRGRSGGPPSGAGTAHARKPRRTPSTSPQAGPGAPPRVGAGPDGGGSSIALVASLAGGRIGRAIELLEGPALRSYTETRDLLLGSLEALAQGLPAGTFAVVGAAAMGTREREDWLEAIGVLELLLRDLAVLSASHEARVANLDVVQRLSALAPVLGARAARALPVLDSVRGDFRVNVNARLAMERILLEAARP